MSDDLTFKYYSNLLLQLKRGYRGGFVVNAKPYLVLALFDMIEFELVRENRFGFDSVLNDRYTAYNAQYQQRFSTPLFRPFFYLTTDGFWHIEWKDKDKPIRVSDSFMCNNVEYAHLDNALWDLLQEERNREALRQNIINFYFKK